MARGWNAAEVLQHFIEKTRPGEFSQNARTRPGEFFQNNRIRPGEFLDKTKHLYAISKSDQSIWHGLLVITNSWCSKGNSTWRGGGMKSDEYKNQDDNYHLDFDNQCGTSNDYITARIARDNPAILEDMKQGKYRSVRADAIDDQVF